LLVSNSLYKHILTGLVMCLTVTCILHAQDSCQVMKPGDQFFAPDKGRHLVGSFMMTVLCGEIAKNHLTFSDSRSQRFGVGMAFSLGLGKELYDHANPKNRFSWKDMAADITGIFLGLVVLGMK
jgi:uncharacterized protein YfiM (DUF2279 family)